ncbi:hypothetical protein HPP92_021726 [Vanilla planifolia]|uniref:Uncharacterized protein n=1 Tax=Vanilla planifolia TaxID=51239 RepID=A0A835Q0B5_VANPL|nr:hypothetical protein HPP92_022043 [Vanilla planifolia]KAG0463250.1 hypothetical protein HPP92_021726 [Vanilla planifolia]
MDAYVNRGNGRSSCRDGTTGCRGRGGGSGGRFGEDVTHVHRHISGGHFLRPNRRSPPPHLLPGAPCCTKGLRLHGDGGSFVAIRISRTLLFVSISPVPPELKPGGVLGISREAAERGRPLAAAAAASEVEGEVEPRWPPPLKPCEAKAIAASAPELDPWPAPAAVAEAEAEISTP